MGYIELVEEVSNTAWKLEDGTSLVWKLYSEYIEALKDTSL